MSEWQFPNAATVEGSAEYYVVRFAPEEARQRIAAVFAWFYQLDGIVAKANDPGIARLKLDWWRDEVEKLSSAQTRHPLSQALAPYCNKGWQKPLLLKSLDEAEARILRKQPDTLEELRASCINTGGALAQLACDHTVSDLPQLNAMGCYREMIKRISRYREDMIYGHNWLPKKMILDHNLDIQSVENLKQSDALSALLKDLADYAGTSLTDINAEARSKPLAYGPALSLVAQSQALARKMQKSNFDVFETRYELSPIHNLWTAWRKR